MKYIFALSKKRGLKDFFCENGFVVIRGIFSLDKCDKFLAGLKKYADNDFSVIHNIERDPPIGKSFKEAEKIYKNKTLVRLMDQLCGAEVVALQNQTLFKEAGTRYALQAWNPHQDNSYPLTPNGEYTTINIFLANADPENGGMYIYPGSHKEGLLPFLPTISYREGPSQNPGNTVVIPEKYKDEKVDLIVKKGDILVLNGHAIHGSYSNTHKTRSRPLFSVSYVPRGTQFVRGKNNNREEIEVR